MSYRIEININEDSQLEDLRGAVLDKEGLHARIAGDAERFVKGPGVAGKISAEQHRTATRLGANPTGHLAEAYEGIESESDASNARLIIPSGTRLTAAFGKQVLVPKKSKFLTIPVDKDSYGKRAREFDDLFVLERPDKALMLARREDRVDDPNSKLALRSRAYKRGRAKDKDAGIEVLFLLLKSVEISEDKTLIPFEELEEVAALSADDFINEAVEAALNA